MRETKKKKDRDMRAGLRGGMVALLSLCGLAAGTVESREGNATVVPVSMVIRGGVSLGAYEAGFDWTMIRMLSQLREENQKIRPDIRALAGASAGSINALLSGIYWCQDPGVSLKNSVEDNLFYDTWVGLGLEDLLVPPDDTENRSTLFTRKALERKADAILRHFRKPIYREGCEVAMGFTVTKAHPIVEEFEGIPIKRQAFSIPLTLRSGKGKLRLSNRRLTRPSSCDTQLQTLQIPGIEKRPEKIEKVLFASSAFPGAFPQVKLRYRYRGKIGEGYFIDGGVYNNSPLDLALALDPASRYFLYIEPDNLRRHSSQKPKAPKEKQPVGFLGANLYPLANAAEIYQQIFFYQAIDRYFRGHPERRLILSSRFHPLTAGFLEHFGAFLDKNFRLYDYHVGVYDAIHQLAKTLRKRGFYPELSQRKMMDRLAKKLGVLEHGESRTAYRFFQAVEYGGKRPGRNRYAAIYNAFKKGVSEEERYSPENFGYFLRHLDYRYLKIRKGSFLAYVRKHPERWYAKPLRYVVTRITALENYHAQVDPSYEPIAELLNALAWGSYTLIRPKEGWEIQRLHAPDDGRDPALYGALRFLPREIAVDSVNGGMSFVWEADYLHDWGWIDGVSLRGSYNFADGKDGGDFLRLDADLFHEDNDTIRYGAGLSAFGNIERSFWDRQSGYGANVYVEFLELFRAGYVWRHGEGVNNHSLYFGIENLPGLFYWLNR